MPFAEQGELEASARIGAGAGAPFGERALDGELKLDIAALDFVSELFPQAQNTQGAVTGDLRVAGTVGTPQLAGSLMLAGGKATFPGTNVELEGVELALAGDGANGLTVNGAARERRRHVAGRGPRHRSSSRGPRAESRSTAMRSRSSIRSTRRSSCRRISTSR